MSHRLVFLPIFVLALGSLVAACGGGGGEEGLPACPEGGTDLTYDNFGQDFFNGYCTSCHTSGSGIAEAQDIPFTSLSAIQAEADEIFEQAGSGNTSMPPGGGPTAAEREQLTEWLSCGAP